MSRIRMSYGVTPGDARTRAIFSSRGTRPLARRRNSSYASRAWSYNSAFTRSVAISFLRAIFSATKAPFPPKSPPANAAPSAAVARASKRGAPKESDSFVSISGRENAVNKSTKRAAPIPARPQKRERVLRCWRKYMFFGDDDILVSFGVFNNNARAARN